MGPINYQKFYFCIVELHTSCLCNLFEGNQICSCQAMKLLLVLCNDTVAKSFRIPTGASIEQSHQPPDIEACITFWKLTIYCFHAFHHYIFVSAGVWHLGGVIQATCYTDWCFPKKHLPRRYPLHTILTASNPSKLDIHTIEMPNKCIR
jgi:hypothetical protein